jgi:hypothetical protein
MRRKIRILGEYSSEAHKVSDFTSFFGKSPTQIGDDLPDTKLEFIGEFIFSIHTF